MFQHQRTHMMDEFQCPYCLCGEGERDRLLTHLVNCHPGRSGKVLLRKQDHHDTSHCQAPAIANTSTVVATTASAAAAATTASGTATATSGAAITAGAVDVTTSAVDVTTSAATTTAGAVDAATTTTTTTAATITSAAANAVNAASASTSAASLAIATAASVAGSTASGSTATLTATFTSADTASTASTPPLDHSTVANISTTGTFATTNSNNIDNKSMSSSCQDSSGIRLVSVGKTPTVTDDTSSAMRIDTTCPSVPTDSTGMSTTVMSPLHQAFGTSANVGSERLSPLPVTFGQSSLGNDGVSSNVSPTPVSTQLPNAAGDISTSFEVGDHDCVGAVENSTLMLTGSLSSGMLTRDGEASQDADSSQQASLGTPLSPARRRTRSSINCGELRFAKASLSETNLKYI